MIFICEGDLPMSDRKYGWKKQQPDTRDFPLLKLGEKRPLAKALPPVVNLRKWCSEVENQKDLGSCTANAWAGMLEYNRCRAGLGGPQYKDYSRLFIYYNERVLEGTVTQDSGAYLRDGAKAIAKWGVCYEDEWPYITDRFTIKPTDACYASAIKRHIHSYYSLDDKKPAKTLENLKTCLASGQCFVFGFMVFESFESDAVTKKGIMQIPNPQTEELLGGHAVMAVGYNDEEKRFLVKNSWGRGWGLKGINAGYFTMPYDFISNPQCASDFWTLVREY